MSKYFKKDNLKRVLSYNIEKEKLFYKYLFFNTNFKKSLRSRAYKIFDFYASKFNQRGQVNLRCIYSGRSRSTSSEFGLSRIAFRKLVSSGSLTGLRKSSW